MQICNISNIIFSMMNAPQEKIEMPLELKKYPLSLEEKREVISTLQYIFKRT